MAGGITRPLRQLESKLAQGYEGNFNGRMEIEAKDEIGNLAVYFNRFMERIENSNRKVQAEINERRKMEELFSKAFRASPSGIFIADLNEKRLIDANQSFLTFIGRDHDATIDKTLDNLSIFQQPGMFNQVIEVLNHNGRIRGLDVEFVDAGGHVQLGIINAETVHIWNKPCILCAVEDLTETKKLEREIIDISERERLQLGQYLHDDLCSHLLGIEVMQKVLAQKMAKQGFSDIESVNRIRDLVQDAIDKTRRISRGLCPTHIAEQELELALQELCSDIEQIFGVTSQLIFDDTKIRLNPSMASHIYYIAREAVYNAIKHGHARHISLNVTRSGSAAELQIIDNGCGLSEKTNGRGMGLRIMHYRANRIGAILYVGSDDISGTRVSLTFNPMAGAPSDQDDTAAS
jgi:PAS domain S-box-containing protein